MDVELSRAETELQSEEAALHAELSRLAEVSSELSTRLAALRTLAAQAGDSAMAQRSQAVPPVIDADAGFSKVRATREAAVRARREVNAAVRGQLSGVKSQLQKLAQQVVADEKATRAPIPSPPAPAPAPLPAASPDLLAAKKAQRTSARVKMQAAVDFTSDNNFFNGFSANISDGGLFVATVNVLPLGTEVDLSFSLPSGERIEARGVVQWVREVNDQMPDVFPGMGVRFAQLQPAALSAITQFLVQRDPLFFADSE